MSLLIKTFGGCAGLCSVFEAQVFRITHIIPVRSCRNKWSENIILNSGVQRKPLLTNNWMIPSEIAKLPRTWNIWLVWEMASVQGKLNRSFFSKWREIFIYDIWSSLFPLCDITTKCKIFIHKRTFSNILSNSYFFLFLIRYKWEWNWWEMVCSQGTISKSWRRVFRLYHWYINDDSMRSWKISRITLL